MNGYIVKKDGSGVPEGTGRFLNKKPVSPNDRPQGRAIKNSS